MLLQSEGAELEWAEYSTDIIVVLHSGDNVRHVVSFPTLFSCVGSTAEQHGQCVPRLRRAIPEVLLKCRVILEGDDHRRSMAKQRLYAGDM